MNGFDRFNIKYLSPTMIAQWDSAPATLVLRRVFGVKGKATPNMWRGEGVEAGLLHFLGNRHRDPNAEANSLTLAVETFWQRAEGEVTEEAEKVAEGIPGMVEQAILATREIDSPILGTQFNIEHFLDDVEAPFTGRMDFLFENKSIIELKTTTRCPSEIDSATTSHRWQAALYASARNQPVTLLYVTSKKFNAFTVEPNDDCLKTMRRCALSLQKALEKASDGLTLLRSVPLNVDSFYWDEEVRAAYEQAVDGHMKALVGPGTENLAAQGYVSFGKHAGKHISELPTSYLDWLLNPKLSSGETFDVPLELQQAIENMRAAA